MLPLPGLHVTENSLGLPVFAISAKGHSITDLTVDESTMVQVPPEYYGLSQEQVDFFAQLNRTLDDASEAAIDAGAAAVQSALGIDDGEVAVRQFKGNAAATPFRIAVGEHIIAEVKAATKT
jgi:hypothetical protein